MSAPDHAPEEGRLWRLVRAFVTGPLSPLLLLVSVVSGLAAGERVAAPVPAGLADGVRVEAAP